MPRRGRTTPPPQMTQPPSGPAPASVTDADMDAARSSGQATPLGQVISYVMRYQDAWWIRGNGRWLQSTAALSAILDNESARITAQDAIVARRAAIRAAVALARDTAASAGDATGQTAPGPPPGGTPGPRARKHNQS